MGSQVFSLETSDSDLWVLSLLGLWAEIRHDLWVLGNVLTKKSLKCP